MTKNQEMKKLGLQEIFEAQRNGVAKGVLIGDTEGINMMDRFLSENRVNDRDIDIDMNSSIMDRFLFVNRVDNRDIDIDMEERIAITDKFLTVKRDTTPDIDIDIIDMNKVKNKMIFNPLNNHK